MRRHLGIPGGAGELSSCSGVVAGVRDGSLDFTEKIDNGFSCGWREARHPDGDDSRRGTAGHGDARGCHVGLGSRSDGPEIFTV